jgi:hypothetical protein
VPLSSTFILLLGRQKRRITPIGPRMARTRRAPIRPTALRSEIKNALEQLANQALDTDGVDAIVLFARSTERWDVPYEAVLYAKKRWCGGPLTIMGISPYLGK